MKNIILLITILAVTSNAFKLPPFEFRASDPVFKADPNVEVPTSLDWGWHPSSSNPNIYKNYLSTIKN